jgi:hypothetical protein
LQLFMTIASNSASFAGVKIDASSDTAATSNAPVFLPRISNVLLTSDMAGGRHPVTLQKIITLRGFAGATVGFAGASDSMRWIVSRETASGAACAAVNKPDAIANRESVDVLIVR